MTLPRVRKTCPLIEKEKCTLQHAVTVEMNVKYHSNQKKTDLFIAENVSKTTNQPQDKVGVDLVEDLVDLVVTEALDLVEETTDHVKCMTQNAVTVEMIAKYHLSQKKTDLFIAETASKTTKIRTIVLSNFQNSFIL
jgi:predicted GIY-YIG superfamily endonuclease